MKAVLTGSSGIAAEHGPHAVCWAGQSGLLGHSHYGHSHSSTALPMGHMALLKPHPLGQTENAEVT